MKQLLLITMLTIFTLEVSADCLYEGTSHPTGTIKGPLICGADGYWRPK
ncbi:MAG: hypothetical protein ACI84K_001389 [Pseudohongiellaceae bacterium]|jgi:hypothetical protein